MRPRSSGRFAALGLTTVLTLGAIGTACNGDGGGRSASPALSAGGDRAEGRRTIVEQGCGSCHRIPGVPNAVALVGPPLDSWSGRSFIAGTLPNSAENLRVWLADPQQVRPGSAMPTIELDDRQIADIVAYLFSLD